jgi:cell division protein FtsB
MDQLGPERKEPDQGPDIEPPSGAPPTAADAQPAQPAPPAEPGAEADATQAFTTPVDTDTAVRTEVVEPPPVHAFVPDEPRGRRRVGGRLSAVIAVLAILAIGGAGALGYSLNQDLTAARANLATTEGDLGTTKTTLTDTTGTLDATTTTLAATKAERSKLDAEVVDLAAQVASQAECVILQKAALKELGVISDLQTDNFNRTTEGSTWAKAEDKRNKAVSDALDAYYQAYSKAFDRNLSSARAWAAKGKEAVAVLAVQAKQQAAEFDLIDRSAATIEIAINKLEEQLKKTETTCEAVN